ncbi:pre-peptidase C-terminal domain-containing protein [Salarchaeum sp. JOR-1]|uniref:pre-peptidase C-terminal domain-containing protein n=1 Tax=Salarchaeum sp. JOR-1 TaxID=2599399 RepID=UPI00119882CB|nr:pre-peptidase C-terminal domain-containing protein [Salarchaeum sp. JOR-1]QDX40794.1 PKD domain-containing protein [Salarchaeum sp. JOR-1]
MRRVHILILFSACLLVGVVAIPTLAATVDPNEPNNGLASATNTTEGRYPANITSGDVDYYKLDLNAGDVVNLEVKFDEDAGNLGLTVVRPDDTYSGDWDSAPDVVDSAQTVDTDEVLAFTAKADATYYVKVNREGSESAPVPYTLLYERTTPSEAQDATYEPNYQFGLAAPITENRHPANLLAGETDYYAIDLNRGDVLDIRMKYDQSAGALRIELYKPDGSDYDSKPDQIDYGEVYDDDRRVEYTAKQNTTYYVKVYGENEDTTSAPYTLLVERIQPPETDIYEVNFNTTLAAPILEGNYSAEVVPSDTDYYAFTAEAGDVINLSVLHTYGDDSNLQLDVYRTDTDDYGTQPDHIIGSNSWSANEYAAFTAKADTTYYVRVTGEDERDAADYTLQYDRITPAETDAYEPNYNYQRAAWVQEGTHTAELRPRETDYYKLDLEAGDVVKFEAFFNHSQKNLQVDIYREDGEDYGQQPQHIEGSETWSDNERVAFTAQKGGTYYIRVYGDDDHEVPRNLEYSFSINRVVPAEGDPYEANYDYESSAVIDAGSFSAELLWGERDFYVIGLQKGDMLSASTVFNDSIENLDLRIYAPDNKDDGSRPQYFDTSESYDNNEQLTLTAPRTGLYYIEVYSQNEGRQPTAYDLTVSRTKNETTPISIETKQAATLAGEQVTVSYTLTNTLSTSVSDVSLDLGTLPGGWQVAGQTAAGGTWDAIDLRWQWATMPGNETKTVTITYQVPDGAVQDIEAIIGTTSVGGDISDIEPSVITVGKTDINTRPHPAFTYRPLNITAGETVSFDASAATDDGTIAQYTWEFPTETVVTTDPTVTHTFMSSGTVAVELSVEDNESASTATSKTLMIQERQVPYFEVSYAVPDPKISTEQRLRVTASVANTGGADGQTNVTLYTDGTKATTKTVRVQEDSTKEVTFFATFATTGTHTVTVGNRSQTEITVAQPADIHVSNYTVSKTTTDPWEKFTITATVVNDGAVAGETTVTFHVGSETTKKTVAVEANATTTVSYTTSIETTGEHSVWVNTQQPTTITVGDQQPSGVTQLAAQYDSNNNGQLGTTEFLTTVQAWQNGKVGTTNFLNLVTYWQNAKSVPTP